MTERPLQIDPSVPDVARIYDYWLGGKNNFAADRALADELHEKAPFVVRLARENRAFHGRVIRHLVAEAGVHQFLDIGTGLPTADNTHEVAQGIAPAARIVYVDNDPMVYAQARALLTSTPAGATDYIHADIRDPEAILRQAAATLDFDQPVALVVIAILHVIPDEDAPWDLLAQLTERLPSGSCVALSHPVPEPASSRRAPGQAAAMAAFNKVMPVHVTLRSPEQIARLAPDGWPLVEPGLLPASQWRPDPGIHPDPTPLWALLARKP